MTCGFYLAELIERFIEDDTVHLDVYNLFLESLRSLDADAQELHQLRAQGTYIENDQARDRTRLLLRYFEVCLLEYVGYEPVLRTCAHCNNELRPEENGFTPALGGQSLSVNALKVLRLLQRTEWEHVPHFHLDTRLQMEVENTMHGLLRFHLERDLKSWSFLEMLR